MRGGYLPLKNGIASPSTVCRLLSRIDEELFALEFMEWIGEIMSTKETHLAIDGKALRAMQEKYEEIFLQERNHDRQEYRWYSVCTECSLLTKTQKEWPFIKTFLKNGSRRRPKPVQDEETGKDIQKTGIISDMELAAEEMGRIKREHWAVENRLHHVLDDTFREDRPPAKKSKHNLALIRKFAYNILRIAMLSGDCAEIMTEAMDDFSDAPFLRKKYVFSGFDSFY